jgi:ATP phosphoribosyltransferase regulatory subunit
VAGEVATLALIVDALVEGGLSRNEIGLQFGDLGLITALLAAVDMPARWRQRLQSQFWRPHAFRAELKRLTADPASLAVAVPEPLRRALTGATVAEAESIVADHLEASGLEPFGSRAVAEIAETARATVEDARARPLPAATANLIEAYVALQAPAGEAADRIGRFSSRAKLELGAPLASFDTRMKRLAMQGIAGTTATFSGSFGRTLEYYTGFVFEVTAKGLPPNSPVAGGGRYDGLMRIAGSKVDVPAVGAAIHTERLLSAVTGGHTP